MTNTPDSSVPAFYICDQSLPRPSALLNGVVLAAAFLAGVCLLIARGGAFPGGLTGSHHANLLPTAAAPVNPSTGVRVKPEPPQLVPFYFRLLALVSTLDANHDGIISAGEIASAPTLLATLDANRDGRLDADECGGNFGDRPENTGPTTDELTRTLMSFDRNHDGKLERSELPERLQGLFDRADPNKTGVLLPADIRQLAATDRAAGAAPLDSQFLQRARLAFMRIHPILAALDTDRNGEISAAEMRNSSAMLRTLDANNDGQLTVNEILPDPLTAAVAQFVSVFDTNNDQTISPEEWTPAFGRRLRQTLTRAGRSRSGLVTGGDLVRQIAIDPATGSEDLTAYQEMLAATRQGFAAIAARSR